LGILYSVRRAGFASRFAKLEIFACSSQAATIASRRDLLISGSNPARQVKIKSQVFLNL
jgi:hypothetical protein